MFYRTAICRVLGSVIELIVSAVDFRLPEMRAAGADVDTADLRHVPQWETRRSSFAETLEPQTSTISIRNA